MFAFAPLPAIQAIFFNRAPKQPMAETAPISRHNERHLPRVKIETQEQTSRQRDKSTVTEDSAGSTNASPTLLPHAKSFRFPQSISAIGQGSPTDPFAESLHGENSFDKATEQRSQNNTPFQPFGFLARRRSSFALGSSTAASPVREPGLLGQGAYAKVYKEADTHDPAKVYAVKKPFPPKTEQDALMLQSEKMISQMVAESGVPYAVKLVKTVSVSNAPDHLYFEFCNKGSVREYMESLLVKMEESGRSPLELATINPIPVKVVKEFIRQVRACVDALHAAGIVHRDIKRDNIYVTLTAEGCLEVRVGDFGVSATRETCERNCSGTPYYMNKTLLTKARLQDPENTTNSPFKNFI